jgi:hypothetical protein
MGPAQSSFEVDLDSLHRLVRMLRDLAREMHERDGSLLATLRDPDLASALRHAERDWSDQRRRLHAYFLSAADAVDRAFRAYAQTDESIAAAARPRSHPSG